MTRWRSLEIALVIAAAAASAYWFFSDVVGPQPRLENRGHFQAVGAGTVSGEEAERYYRSILPDMVRRYKISDYPITSRYSSWKRINIHPYLSSSHGLGYVNNYANDDAKNYPPTGEADAMPVGATIAKDAFAITKDRDVFAQPLFVMEKLGKGMSPATGDWRYVMITAAGEIYGDTLGRHAEKVKFCHSCHKKAGKRDYLFGVPPEFDRQ